MVRHKNDHLTLDLLQWTPPPVRVGYDATETRGGSLDASIARALSLALTRCATPRADIARNMSDQLGRKISKDMLDAWTSQARTGNRIPLDAFAALIGATGEHDLLGLLPGMFGYAVVPERYAEIIELHLIEDKKAELERRAAALTARVRGARI